MARLANALDRAYLAGAWIAGGLLVLLALLVLYSIFARVFGLFAGGATDVAGYVMATSTFMALAYTFRSEGHIRVSLVIQSFTGAIRQGLELWCLGCMALISGYLAFYMSRLAYDSWRFGERSEGADAILIWIPQTPVALGSTLFAISVLHTFIAGLAGPGTLTPERIDPQSE